jgi:glyoxylase-like metal-dependent hydrolase (beta-lactamase superfamily II)
MKEILKDIYLLKPYTPTDLDCCVYMINTRSDDGLILIDAGLYLEPIENIQNFGFDPKQIKHLLITHAHLDHFGVSHKLKIFNNDIKFYAHHLDADKIEKRPTDQYIEQYYSDYEFEPVKLAKKIKKDNEILKFGNYEFRCIHIPGHTPGSLAYLLEIGKKKILFGGDVPGTALESHGSNFKEYIKSMEKLLELDIDILCEGHSEIIEPANKVKKNINGYIKLNENLRIVGEVDPKDKKALFDLTMSAYEVEFYENALDFCNYLLEVDPDNVEAQLLFEKIKDHNPSKIKYIKGLIKQNFDNLM